MTERVTIPSKAQRVALERASKHPFGIADVGTINGFGSRSRRLMLNRLCAAGLLEPNAHGDYYITDAGRAACAHGEEADKA